MNCLYFFLFFQMVFSINERVISDGLGIFEFFSSIITTIMVSAVFFIGSIVSNNAMIFYSFYKVFYG